MSHQYSRKMYAEMIAEFGTALGLVITAISHQIDPGRFASDLRHYAEIFAELDGKETLSIRLAAACIAAAEAAALRLSQAKH